MKQTEVAEIRLGSQFAGGSLILFITGLLILKAEVVLPSQNHGMTFTSNREDVAADTSRDVISQNKLTTIPAWPAESVKREFLRCSSINNLGMLDLILAPMSVRIHNDQNMKVEITAGSRCERPEALKLHFKKAYTKKYSAVRGQWAGRRLGLGDDKFHCTLERINRILTVTTISP